MNLVGNLVIGGLTLVFGLGGLPFAVAAVREFLEAVPVVTGPAGLPDGDGEHATYLDATVADDPDLDTVVLGQVHDTFGYWIARDWASGARTNLFTMFGRAALKLGWGPEAYRDDGDRRRGWAVLPASVPVRIDGRLERLSFDEGAYPLQRLETDGGTVPFLAGLGVPVLVLGSFLGPVLGGLLFVSPLAGLALVALVAAVPVGLLAGKLYHDTGRIGRWATVTALDDGAVPPGLAAADETPDPDVTARANVATADPGDPLRVVGTVESMAEGYRVIDGVVSTQGRWFLAVAATLDAVRTLAFAAVALLPAAAGVVLLAPSLVGF